MIANRAYSNIVILSASDEDARRTSTQEFAARIVHPPVAAASFQLSTVDCELP